MAVTVVVEPRYRRRRLLEWVALHSFAVALALLFVLPSSS